MADVKKTLQIEFKTDKAVKKLRELDQKIEETEKKINDIAGKNGTLSQEKILAKQTGNWDAYDAENKKLKELEATKKAAQQRSKQLQNQILNEQKAILSENGSIDQMAANLNRLKQTYRSLSEDDRNSRSGKDILKNINTLDSAIKKADKSLGQYQRNVGNYASMLKGFGKTFFLQMAMGYIGVAQGVVAIGAAFKNAIRTGIEFNRSIGKLKAILNGTSSDMEKLRQRAEDLGATTRYTATEVASLEIELAKLGYQAEDIIKMSKAVLLFAQATGAELPEAAKLAGATLRIFQKDTAFTLEFVDKMAKATNSSALSFEYLATAMPIVGSTANTFGFTLEETLSLLGSLANAGVEASMAATAIRNIFFKLADTNGTLAKKIGGPVTNIYELVDAFKKLNKEGVSLVDVLEMTDKRSANAFSQFLSQYDKIIELNNKIANESAGTAEQMANDMEDNLGGEIKRLSSAWEQFELILNGTQGKMQKVVATLKEVVSFLSTAVMSADQVQDRYNREEEDRRATYHNVLTQNEIEKYKKSFDEGRPIEEILAEIETREKNAFDEYKKRRENRKGSERNIENEGFFATAGRYLKKLNPFGSIYTQHEKDLMDSSISESLAFGNYKSFDTIREYIKDYAKDRTPKREKTIETDDEMKARLQLEKRIAKANLEAQKKYEQELHENSLDSADKRRYALEMKYDQEIDSLKYKVDEELKVLKAQADTTPFISKDAKKNIADAIDAYEQLYEEKVGIIEQQRQKAVAALNEHEKQIAIRHAQDIVNLQLDAVRKGSEEEYKLKQQSIANNEALELSALKELALKDEEIAENLAEHLEAINAKYVQKNKELDDEWTKTKLDQGMIESEIAIANSRTEIEALAATADAKNEYYRRILEAGKLYTETQEKYNLRLAKASKDAYAADKQYSDARFQLAMSTSSAIAGSFGAISQAIEQCSEENEENVRRAKILGLAEIYIQQAVSIAQAIHKAWSSSSTWIEAIAATATSVTTVIASSVQAISSIKKAKFAKGVIDLQGKGTSTSDSIDARLSKGESVMTARATKMFKPWLAAMNAVAAQPNVTLPNMYSQYNPTQTMANNEGFGNTMREVMQDVHPVVAVKEINEVGERMQRIQVLDNF